VLFGATKKLTDPFAKPPEPFWIVIQLVAEDALQEQGDAAVTDTPPSPPEGENRDRPTREAEYEQVETGV
jgi:hypothetical protein